MWIRSQDKKVLLDCRGVRIVDCCTIDLCRYEIYGYGISFETKQYLGGYSTKEKALTVLDILQKRLCVIEEWNVSKALMQRVPQNRLCIDTNGFVFMMPADDEVK